MSSPPRHKIDRSPLAKRMSLLRNRSTSPVDQIGFRSMSNPQSPPHRGQCTRLTPSRRSSVSLSIWSHSCYDTTKFTTNMNGIALHSTHLRRVLATRLPRYSLPRFRHHNIVSLGICSAFPAMAFRTGHTYSWIMSASFRRAARRPGKSV